MEIENINIHSLPFLIIPERENLPQCGGVYFVLSENNNVEYIGKAKNLYKRWRRHECCINLDSPKSCLVAWIEINDESERIEFEKQAIRKFNPRCNIKHIDKPPKPVFIWDSEKKIDDFLNVTESSENFLKASEVAKRYGVSSVSVRSWIKKGLLPNAKFEESILGSAWLIPESDLIGFVKPEQGRAIKPKAKEK